MTSNPEIDYRTKTTHAEDVAASKKFPKSAFHIAQVQHHLQEFERLRSLRESYLGAGNSDITKGQAGSGENIDAEKLSSEEFQARNAVLERALGIFDASQLRKMVLEFGGAAVLSEKLLVKASQVLDHCTRGTSQEEINIKTKIENQNIGYMGVFSLEVLEMVPKIERCLTCKETFDVTEDVGNVFVPHSGLYFLSMEGVGKSLTQR
jgi:hypothetical protein